MIGSFHYYSKGALIIRSIVFGIKTAFEKLNLIYDASNDMRAQTQTLYTIEHRIIVPAQFQQCISQFNEADHYFQFYHACSFYGAFFIILLCILVCMLQFNMLYVYTLCDTQAHRSIMHEWYSNFEKENVNSFFCVQFENNISENLESSFWAILSYYQNVTTNILQVLMFIITERNEKDKLNEFLFVTVGSALSSSLVHICPYGGVSISTQNGSTFKRWI